jgi:hypothetical protein
MGHAADQGDLLVASESGIRGESIALNSSRIIFAKESYGRLDELAESDRVDAGEKLAQCVAE